MLSLCTCFTLSFFTFQCLSPEEFFSSFRFNNDKAISEHDFLHVCPALIYELAVANCAVQVDGNLQTKFHVRNSGDSHGHGQSEDAAESGLILPRQGKKEMRHANCIA